MREFGRKQQYGTGISGTGKMNPKMKGNWAAMLFPKSGISETAFGMYQSPVTVLHSLFYLSDDY
jgi:hypothetical protein